jgi:four helix bundle protein
MKAEGEGPEDLRTRTKRYGLSVIAMYVRLPRRLDEARVLGGQFLRSGTSVGAHYREGCRARSDAEFISKIEVALQELDETAYWLELFIESGIYNRPDAVALLAETDELIRIFVTIMRKRKGG